MAFIKDTVYKQLSNLKPEKVLLPRNWVHIFLHTIPNPLGSAKQDSCIRKNGKAEDKEDGSEFLLLPCVPFFLCFGGSGYDEPSVSMQILTVVSINIKNTDTI